MVLELQLAQHLVCLLFYLPATHSVDASKESDILCHCQVLVQREALRHIADMALDLFILRTDVIPHHASRTARRLVQACQHVHGGGLSCTVGTKETEDFPSLHCKRDVVNSTERAKRFHQVLHLDDKLLSCPPMEGFKGGRIENIFELIQYPLWRVDATNPTLVEKRHTPTTAHFIEIRCAHHHRDATLLVYLQQHLP